MVIIPHFSLCPCFESVRLLSFFIVVKSFIKISEKM